MSLIEWKDHFSLGVPEIDVEHRELIELINELYASVQRGGTDSTTADFLGELYTRIAAHFAIRDRTGRMSGFVPVYRVATTSRPVTQASDEALARPPF